MGITNFIGWVCDLPYGLAVRIPGFHPGGPGSTPGMGTQIIFNFLNSAFVLLMKQFVFFLPSSFSDTIIQIILCPKKKQCVDFISSLKDLLQQNRINSELLGEPFVTNVAKHSPLTRKQFNEASSCWPVNFHEDK